MKSISHFNTARDKTLHIETEGAIVNIRIGLNDPDGHEVTHIEILPDDHYFGESRWALDGSINNRLIKELK